MGVGERLNALPCSAMPSADPFPFLRSFPPPKKKHKQKEVLDFQYDSTYFRRGLVIDKERGNVIKMDRHKYVRQVYHGFSPLPTATRKELYMSSSEHIPLYTESNFVNIDTLFLLVDAYLFAQLVELKDKTQGAVPHSYATIYAHIRQCVDLCHRDGVIKVGRAVGRAVGRCWRVAFD